VPVTPSRDRRRSSRGQSLVELALIAPVFLILLLTAIDLGRLMYSQITITNAAKEGALVASQGGTFQANQPCSDTNDVMCGVLTEAKGGFIEVDQAKVTLSPAVCEKNAEYPTSGTPPNVAVTVQAPFRLVTPIIGAIIAPNITLTGTAQAQCLVVPDITFPATPAPTASFTVSPTTTGTVPFTATFDASGSTSPGAAITNYAWSFGATGKTASKTYTAAGTYTVTLTVTNSFGATATASQTITVNPTGTPTCAPITISFTASDASNKQHPHQMSFSASQSPTSPSISNSNWQWQSGTLTDTGKNGKLDFATSGPQTVTLTGTDGTCTFSATQTVTAP
jgi:Flp pilus assembly protein TadG